MNSRDVHLPTNPDHRPPTAAYRDELVDAGLLIPLGVPGLYGRSGVFEGVIEHFERFVTRMGADSQGRR